MSEEDWVLWALKVGMGIGVRAQVRVGVGAMLLKAQTAPSFLPGSLC